MNSYDEGYKKGHLNGLYVVVPSLTPERYNSIMMVTKNALNGTYKI